MFPHVRALLSAYLAKVSAYQAEALLTLLYWTVIGLTAIAARLLRTPPMPGAHGRGEPRWIERRPFPSDPSSLSRQY